MTNLIETFCKNDFVGRKVTKIEKDILLQVSLDVLRHDAYACGLVFYINSDKSVGPTGLYSFCFDDNLLPSNIMAEDSNSANFLKCIFTAIDKDSDLIEGLPIYIFANRILYDIKFKTINEHFSCSDKIVRVASRLSSVVIRNLSIPEPKVVFEIHNNPENRLMSGLQLLSETSTALYKIIYGTT